jgi:glutathione peroxidase-family protein
LPKDASSLQQQTGLTFRLKWPICPGGKARGLGIVPLFRKERNAAARDKTAAEWNSNFLIDHHGTITSI